MKFIREKFDNLDPSQKKWAILLTIGLVVMSAGYWTYSKKQQNRAPEVVSKEKPHQIGFDKDLVEKSLIREQRQEAEKTRAEMAALQARLEQLEGGQSATPSELKFPPPPPVPSQKEGESASIALPTAEEVSQARTFPPPPPPSPVGLGGFRTTQAPPIPEGSLPEEEIGGIGSLTNSDLSAGSAKDGDRGAGKKKDETQSRTIYLPPSFMQAELISGGDISTSGQASGNPEPFFIRIQTPAQLPNDIKLRLSGCFVVAEGTGRLDKERAMIRTVSLSCLGKNGESIIDEQIKGYVADVDSKNGLAGKVVFKAGAAIARTFLAGVAEGVGKAFEASSQTQTISGLTGTTTTIVDSGQLTKSAVGGGVAESSKTLKEFYLELAKNTTPVVEIKAARKVTVFITEGKQLQIKEAVKGEEP